MVGAGNPLMNNYALRPVTFVRGSGVELWDSEGKRYLDFLAGIGVTSLGHAHPAVADALCDQARRLLHVSNLFGSLPGDDVARAIDRLLGGGGQVVFANSGAETNECAIKLARRWGGPGRHVVVTALRSNHGRTLATLRASGVPAKHPTYEPLPAGFRHVEWDDLKALDEALTDDVAAVMLEPVQGGGGVWPATEAYFRGVRRLCDERGIIFIVDEIQTGFARTGRWFGHQHFGVEPDVVTMAKALGNGVPIGACWARAEVAALFRPGDHATTFGGQPLAASAARAVLAELERIDAPALAARAGKRLSNSLAATAGVRDVRGLGLLIAAELDDGYDADTVTSASLRAGLVVNAVTQTAIRFAPPLIVSPDQVDEAVGIFAAVLAASAPPDPLSDYRPTLAQDRIEQIWRRHEQAYRESLIDHAAEQTFDYLGTTIVVPRDVMPINEVSHLLGEAVLAETRPGDTVLDMGTGSGVNAILAATRGAHVLAVDINDKALAATRANVKRNGAGDRVEVRHSDVFDNVDAEFDLIVFNPPFRWFRPRSLFEVSTTDEGYRALARFFRQAKDHLSAAGRMLIFFGTSGDLGYFTKLIDAEGFAAETVAHGELARGDWQAEYFTFRVTRPHGS